MSSSRPWALSKDLWCPRDGERDCSMVDALRLNENSAKANWFLGWFRSDTLFSKHLLG